MKATRIAAILMLAFLFGGSSAEVAVQAKRAIERHRSAEPGAVGNLVALEIRGEGGEILARPRAISVPGRPSVLLLRDPFRPGLVRLSLRISTAREPSGDVAVQYEIGIPSASLVAAGSVVVDPGVEQPLDLGSALTAKLLAIPVPSAAFDAFLEAERARRAGADPS